VPRLLQRRGGGLDAGLSVQEPRDAAVNAVGVDAGDDLVLALVHVLVPDQGADGGVRMRGGCGHEGSEVVAGPR